MRTAGWGPTRASSGREGMAYGNRHVWLQCVPASSKLGAAVWIQEDQQMLSVQVTSADWLRVRPSLVLVFRV